MESCSNERQTNKNEEMNQQANVSTKKGLETQRDTKKEKEKVSLRLLFNLDIAKQQKGSVDRHKTWKKNKQWCLLIRHLVRETKRRQTPRIIESFEDNKLDFHIGE